MSRWSISSIMLSVGLFLSAVPHATAQQPGDWRILSSGQTWRFEYDGIEGRVNALLGTYDDASSRPIFRSEGSLRLTCKDSKFRIIITDDLFSSLAEKEGLKLNVGGEIVPAVALKTGLVLEPPKAQFLRLLSLLHGARSLIINYSPDSQNYRTKVYDNVDGLTLVISMGTDESKDVALGRLNLACK